MEKLSSGIRAVLSGSEGAGELSRVMEEAGLLQPGGGGLTTPGLVLRVWLELQPAVLPDVAVLVMARESIRFCGVHCPGQ